ncbi:hypothetical protein U2F15_02330 [Acinetobacter baumannii]|uniref:hypothetical protein n=1 Tax=Acinetobacter baumannii TaxID=470 RepID=UPI00338F27DC
MDKFQEALQQHKVNLTKSLSEFGEGHRLNRLHKEIDSNAADYEYYFNAGQQSQQAKVEELQKRVDSLEKAEFKLAQVKAILQNNPKLLESILIKKIEQALKGGCKHESDGSHLLSKPPKTKCKKCGEIYSADVLKGEG